MDVGELYRTAIKRLMEDGEIVESFLLANSEFEKLQALCRPLPGELGAEPLLGVVLSVIMEAVDNEAAKIAGMCTLDCPA